MLIRIGYEIVHDCTQPTPMLLLLHTHFSRVSDFVRPDHMMVSPSVPMDAYRDSFGNWCTRIVAPAGPTTVTADALIRDSGQPDPMLHSAIQHPVEELPAEVLTFLLGSRYCETDRLMEAAWDLFGHTPPGWQRVQAICDYVHNHITFDYFRARPTMTALDVFNERFGVCRDYTHLAIAFLRCLNIPARYCTGYLSDIGFEPTEPDFAAWLEVWLNGGWRIFDPRNNAPRYGRILIARGRDATDVPISLTFGPNTLQNFRVWTYPVDDAGG